MIAILGWVLFAVTIVVAIWRDFHEQAEAEKGYQEDVRYFQSKYDEWQAEKHSYLARIDQLTKDHLDYQHNVAKLRKACAIIESTYDDDEQRELAE